MEVCGLESAATGVEGTGRLAWLVWFVEVPLCVSGCEMRVGVGSDIGVVMGAVVGLVVALYACV
jgi:hypothetical protein